MIDRLLALHFLRFSEKIACFLDDFIFAKIIITPIIKILKISSVLLLT